MKIFNSIILKLSALALTMMLAFNNASAQMPTDSIIADFNEFVRLLEETHPDPYTNYGGRPFFRRAAMETRSALIQDKVTSANELSRRINQFIVPLHDGHTGINLSDNMSMFTKKAAPVRFQAINDAVIIEAISSNHKDLIGSRLLAIENIPVKEICEGLALHYRAENEIGKAANICGDMGFLVDYSKVIPNMPKDSLTYQILTPDGERMNLTLPLVPLMQIMNMDFTRPEHSDLFPQGFLSYSFVDEQNKTMYFSSQGMYDHDALEFMRDHKEYSQKYHLYLQKLYQLLYNKKMPADEDEALAKIPSFSGVFEEMLQEMKKNKSQNLIIDLRDNGGGFTHITIATLYLMWGDKYLKNLSQIEGGDAKLVSPLMLKKFDLTLDQFNAQENTNYEMGDYTFEDKSDIVENITGKVRNKFISNCMSGIKDKLAAQKGKPVYTPENIYVLTGPNTFSAAFHYAFFLWKMGAKVVGVTSTQAPNTYMEETPFELPRTKLKGSISNTLQLFLPVDDPRAKDFTPDLMPTYEDYKRYNFDDNTIPLYLMDYIKGQKE